MPAEFSQFSPLAGISPDIFFNFRLPKYFVRAGEAGSGAVLVTVPEAAVYE